MDFSCGFIFVLKPQEILWNSFLLWTRCSARGFRIILWRDLSPHSQFPPAIEIGLFFSGLQCITFANTMGRIMLNNNKKWDGKPVWVVRSNIFQLWNVLNRSNRMIKFHSDWNQDFESTWLAGMNHLYHPQYHTHTFSQSLSFTHWLDIMVPCQTEQYKASVPWSTVLSPDRMEGSLAVRSLHVSSLVSPIKAASAVWKNGSPGWIFTKPRV